MALSMSARPHLSNISEVESLSNKLIDAINRQTTLDDTLTSTRHELAAAHARIRELEATSEAHRATLTDERRQHAQTERDKKAIELELENLTSALFEEANKMVITARENARHEYDLLQKKNDLLQSQLSDSETLLKSSQDQLSELKNIMVESAPPTPVLPEHPTVLRFDVAAYDDLLQLLHKTDRSSGSSYLLTLPASPTQFPLRETKFFKRALAEDVEPTLRLDTAPGLSWLARRSVLTAMCDGTLVVEPLSTTQPCALCGETRADAEHVRTHRFKTHETDTAQHPLCKYCHGRVRSTCDFLGFLRILHQGHWPDGDRAAWEESVRLREQMFWCRIGRLKFDEPDSPSATSGASN